MCFVILLACLLATHVDTKLKLKKFWLTALYTLLVARKDGGYNGGETVQKLCKKLAFGVISEVK